LYIRGPLALNILYPMAVREGSGHRETREEFKLVIYLLAEVVCIGLSPMHNIHSYNKVFHTFLFDLGRLSLSIKSKVGISLLSIQCSDVLVP